MDESSHGATSVVSDRYDNEDASQFYKIVMGDGGDDIHYGIYENADDTTRQAIANTVFVLIRLAESRGAVFGDKCHILDMGAGNGGSAHRIAQETGSHVTCVNFCEAQNACNKAKVEELNLKDRVDVITGDMKKLPLEWDEKFDVIWSIDAYFHVDDTSKLFSECYRVLKKGGIMVFSDILAGVNADPAILATFKNRLHVDEMCTHQKYEDVLNDCGFEKIQVQDWTEHLVTNYQRMAQRASTERARLDKCSDRFLEDYKNSLLQDVAGLRRGEAQTWMAFVASKPV